MLTHPGFSGFEPDADGVLRPYGLMVLDLEGGLVSDITGFPATPGRTIDAAFDLQPA